MSDFGKKAVLFDSDDDDGDNSKPGDELININNNYAERYNDWRRKEELQKLKDRYGDSLDVMSEIDDSGGDDDGSSDDDEDDDTGESLQEDPFDEDFFQVYTALKTKDPKIYNPECKFYQERKDDEDQEPDQSEEEEKDDDQEKKKQKKLTLTEYHKKLIEEKKGITEEDEMMNGGERSDETPGYYEELYDIRRNLKNIIKQNDDDDDENEDDLFTVKGQTSVPKSKKTEQKFVPPIWSDDSKLDENEKFLKNFIMNKAYAFDEGPPRLKEEPVRYKSVDSRFKITDNAGDNDNDSETEDLKFSSKIKDAIDVPKFHYEEPDATVIKRYPRNISSVRDTVVKDKKSKRAEIRERKKLEKEQELKRLRKMKREEIEQRIKMLKKVSGNQSLDLKDWDLNVIIDDENDFDAEKYDRKMQLLFGDDYYSQPGEDASKKPTFEHIPEIDDAAEDDDDLDQVYQEEEETKKPKKKNKKEIKKRRDIMADDDIGLYDDLIGGQVATRFRYRMVEPNDFGLTDEEILMADDKELNKWCSLKKMSQYRPKEAEIYDQKVYRDKARNMDLKKKIFKSLYSEENKRLLQEEDDPEDNHGPEHNNGNDNDVIDQHDEHNNGKGDSQDQASSAGKKKRRRKKKKKKQNAQEEGHESSQANIEPANDASNNDDGDDNLANQMDTAIAEPSLNGITSNNSGKKRHRGPRQKKRKRGDVEDNNGGDGDGQISGVSLQRLKAYGISNKELKKMKKRKH